MDFVLGPEDCIEFVFDEHRDRTDPPVMLIRNFTQAEHREYMRLLKSREAKAEDMEGALVFQSSVLKIGWSGWRNVRNGDGKDVPFKAGADGRPTDDQIDRLTMRQRAQLFSAIANQSPDLTEEQRKNLGLPSRSTLGPSSETAADVTPSRN